MGIIDYLSPYATRKKIAHLLKRGLLFEEPVQYPVPFHCDNHARMLFFGISLTLRGSLGSTLQCEGRLLFVTLHKTSHLHGPRIAYLLCVNLKTRGTSSSRSSLLILLVQATMSLVRADFYASRFQEFLAAGLAHGSEKANNVTRQGELLHSPRPLYSC